MLHIIRGKNLLHELIYKEKLKRPLRGVATKGNIIKLSLPGLCLPGEGSWPFA